MEQVGPPEYGIWIKDYDSDLINRGSLSHWIEDAAKLAALIPDGKKFIHITAECSPTALLINPSALKAMADADCRLEIYAYPE